MARKILINKSDTVEHAIELIRKSPESDLVLVVPRGARLRNSRDELRTLREAVEEMGKTITIESIDEELLALAHAAHLPATHPFFHADRRGHGMSDIVRPSQNDVEPLPSSRKVPVRRDEAAEDELKPKAAPAKTVPVVVEPIAEDVQEETVRDEYARPAAPRGRGLRTALIALVVLVLIGTGATAAGAFSDPGVDVTLREVPWTYDGVITIATTAGTSTPENATIPGQLFVSRKNVTQGYPATGAADGSGTYAEGKIKVFNNYDTNPQELVVRTRFLTPDGKLFRLKEGITIPAATKQGDVLTPASVEATVIADQPGEAYNLSDPNIKLSIPGFAGTPRATGFYGMMVATTGGGSGEGKKVTTDADVKQAESQITTLLEQSFRAALAASQPKDLTVIEGATEVTVEHSSVDRTTDESGNFSLFVDAKLQAIAFREADLRSLLLRVGAGQQAVQDPAEWDFRTLNITYSEPQPALSSGTMQVKVHAEGVLVTALSAERVASLVAGKSSEGAEAAIRALHDVADVDVSTGPLWRRAMPAEANGSEIRVTVR